MHNLDLVWRCADLAKPVLAESEVRALGSVTTALLTGLGFLVRGPTSRFVACPECDNGHVAEYEVVEGANGTKAFFIPCPEHGRVEIQHNDMMQHRVSFQPLVDMLIDDLEVKDGAQECISGRLWNIGRCALAGQSRPIWLGRALRRPDARAWVDRLPTGKSPILFVLGTMPEEPIRDLAFGQVIELRSVVYMQNGELVLDVDSVAEHVTFELATNPQRERSPRKDAKRAEVIQALKSELRQHFLSMKALLHESERSGQTVELPHLTQKQLAERIGESESAVSRAINQGKDQELRLMLKHMCEYEYVRTFSS